MLLENKYLYDLQLYFRDTPASYVARNVCFMGTEGGLLRIINREGECQWWPLAHVFNIRQLARRPYSPPSDTHVLARLRMGPPDYTLPHHDAPDPCFTRGNA